MDISYSALRQNLKKAIDDVTNEHEPMIITSHNKKMAVLISYDDFESLRETAYLMKSPVMAKRLLVAIADIKAGKVIKHGLMHEK